MPIQALILAAGRGSRLGESADEIPKCLIEVGGKRLIEHQIETLADAGVGPVHLVIGYCAEEIRELVGMRADYVVNRRWEQTNSLYSFQLASEAITGDLFILNSDVLFAPDVIGRLLDHPGDAIAYDSGSGQGREQMKIEGADGRLVRMSKSLPTDRSIGENLGILKLTGETARTAFEHARTIAAEGGENRWIGDAINATAAERELHLVDVGDLPWVEIDFAADLRRARREVWPQIAGGSWRRQKQLKRAGWLVAATLLVLALYLGAMFPPPGSSQPVEWESLPMAELDRVQVDLQSHFQEWWLLPPGARGEVELNAPTELRVESRLLDPASGDEPYVIELTLDGERLDWFKLNTRPSGKATHASWTVGRKKRFTFKVDRPGRLGFRLVAPAESSALVRFRRAVESSED